MIAMESYAKGPDVPPVRELTLGGALRDAAAAAPDRPALIAGVADPAARRTWTYAMGGDNGSAYLATVEAYDPAADTWTTRAPMPTARYGPNAVVINGLLYAVGGASPSSALATLEVYDATTNTWATRASMPTPRYDFGAAAINGILYAVGGQITNDYLTTLEAYHP